MQKLTAILLSFLVLVASSGITIGAHICQGELTGIAVGGLAEHCEHSSNTVNDNCHGQCDKKDGADSRDQEGSCCEDTVYELDNIDDFQLPALVSIADQIVLLQPLILNRVPQQSAHFNQLHKRPYSELLVEQDIPVLVQSFLI
jgi:hypothetical protein